MQKTEKYDKKNNEKSSHRLKFLICCYYLLAQEGIFGSISVFVLELIPVFLKEIFFGILNTVIFQR